MQQSLAWLFSLFFIVALAVVYVAVAFSARRTVKDYAPVQTRAYRLRGRLFAALLVLGAGLMIGTLVDLPYTAANHAAPNALQVEAVGHQFHWSLSADSAEVGQTVVFNVSSADVNHGFAIYDADLRLLAQTQAMPGYTNRLVHTFDRPGEYRILCLEYCGIAHHAMDARFTVTAAR